LIHLL